MRSMIWVLWPSFVAAAIAEFVFFAVADPKQLYWMGEQVNFSVSGTYSIGFLFFWMICAGSSVLTYLLLPPRIRRVLATEPEIPDIEDSRLN